MDHLTTQLVRRSGAVCGAALLLSLTTPLRAMGVTAPGWQHGTSTHATASKPLTLAGLEKSLRMGGVHSPELVAIIRKRGVDFALDHDTELELRGAGADANIIEAVGQNYRGTAAPVSTTATTKAPPPVRATTAPPPPPPLPPAFLDVTLPAGTVLPVQLTQTLDSNTARVGQVFTGVVFQDVLSGNAVAIPRNTAVSGRVTEAKDAAHFAGSSLLTLELSSVRLPSSSGPPATLTTAAISKQGQGRGKTTAGKAAGGAAVGAIMGGIFGGGKGAAIGAAAGGGAGAGSSAITKGEQVQFPSESVLQFTLSAPVLLHVPNPALAAPAANGYRQALPQ